MSDRLIACLLVTHLPVKAELKRCPELRGKPVVITESYGSKTLVLDSSPEARGVATGMSLQEATSRCKDAVLLQAARNELRSAHFCHDGAPYSGSWLRNGVGSP